MVASAPAVPVRPRAWPALAAAAALAALLLWWAKWAPYAAKVHDLSVSHVWSGGSLLAAAGVEPGSAPSLAAGVRFAHAYGLAVWKALVAGLVLAAAVQALVPRDRLVRALARRTPAGSAVVGGLLATPSMMCSCCAAPVASALRRSGVPVPAAVAYWLGNPLLNPAVLVFLALVAPWQWVVTRALVGAGLVVAAAAAVDRLAARPVTVDVPPPAPEGPAARRFASSLARTALVVLPEYVVVVVLVGTFSGWLFPLGADARSWGVLGVVVAVVLGTAMVVPTAGEVPVAQGLAAVGAGGAVVGALLVTLPAVSLPSMALVVRALSVRVTLVTAATVVAGGLVAAAVLPALLALTG